MIQAIVRLKDVISIKQAMKDGLSTIDELFYHRLREKMEGTWWCMVSSFKLERQARTKSMS